VLGLREQKVSCSFTFRTQFASLNEKYLPSQFRFHIIVNALHLCHFNQVSVQIKTVINIHLHG
jgi:hypothetical protein